MQHRWFWGIGVPLTIAGLFLAAWLTVVSARPEQAKVTWQMVGQIGGQTQAVVVQGNYAYVGVGLRVIVLDISNPITPTEVGSTTPFPYFVEDIAVSGDPSTGSGQALAYVAAGGAGLRVVDVSNPADPTELGAWDSPGYAEGVTAAGNYAYLADGPYGLRVIDISDPVHPTPAGSAYDMNYAFEVAVSGDYAYIAAAGAGLLVANVSDPAHPFEVGGLDMPGYAYGIAINGTTVYIADAWEGLRVVNIYDPAHPVEVGVFDTPGWALNVVVAGSTAYVADGAFGLRIVDISDPAHPHEVGAYEIYGLARRVAVAEGTAYVADLRAGLRVVDMNDLAHPTQTSLYSPMADASRVAVAGNYAYVAAGYSGLRVVDISNPQHPKEVAVYDTDPGNATAVVISGTYAYIATFVHRPYDLHILDISDPTHPVRIAAIDIKGVFRDIVLQGEILFVGEEGGFRLLDVTDPLSPTTMSFIGVDQLGGAGVAKLAVSGTLAYLADGIRAMHIVDVSNPYSPTIVGILNSPTGIGAVAVAGNFAFVADQDLGVVDVSDPTHPVKVGALHTPGNTPNVAISGQVVYVSDGGGGVVMVDVSDPYTPTLLDISDTPGLANDTVIMGNYAYVADGHNGLVILSKVADSSVTHLENVQDYRVLPTTSPVPLSPMPLSDISTITALETTARDNQPTRRNTSVATTWVVTSKADSGVSSLRQALLDAGSGDTITFDPAVFPPTSPMTISITSALPALTQGFITLDASNAGVILDGSGTPTDTHGLIIVSDGNVLKGLQILNFHANGINLWDGAKNNVIGGNRLLGSGPLGEGNLISGNLDSGAMSIYGTGTMSNTISGNLIGTDLSGTRIMGNGTGISIAGGASYNRIGGMTNGEGNVIGGSRNEEIVIRDPGTDHNILANNLIVEDPSGAGTSSESSPAQEPSTGVRILLGAQHNVIGPGNVIRGFTDGVVTYLPDTVGNTITANEIYDNLGKGIANTSGGNRSLPPPIISSVTVTTVVGTALAGATVEIFSDREDEGQVYEGTTSATASGVFTFTKLAGLTGPHITATATDVEGNTSEFSAPVILWAITHIVTSPLDSGPGTLRQILLDAKWGDTITFDPSVFPPSSPVTISLSSELPHLIQGYVTIDASDAGVILDGNHLTEAIGLFTYSDHNVIMGLQILHFYVGIVVDGNNNVIGGDRMQGSGPLGQGNLISGNNAIGIDMGGRNNLVIGNLVGTDVTGMFTLPNKGHGIRLCGAVNCKIGGTHTGERNIISGNGIGNGMDGMEIMCRGTIGNEIIGNYIGTDITGSRALGNGWGGVVIYDGPYGNTVGGAEPGEGNLISGNVVGVVIANLDANNNTVIGNYIGTDATGTAALGNITGIMIDSSGFNRIGGTGEGERNVISGNTRVGVSIGSYQFSNNLILGNYIGTDPSGTFAVGNGIGVGIGVGRNNFVEGNVISGNNGNGLVIGGAGAEYNFVVGNTIGLDASESLPLGNNVLGGYLGEYVAHNFIQDNAIAYNLMGGVGVSNSPYNTLRRNSIYSHTPPGIILVNDGNQMLPAPVITSVTPLTISGTACPACTVEVFSDAEDEGRFYEGSAVADASGHWVLIYTHFLAGPYVTATATDGEGNTSEFSLPQIVWKWIYLPIIFLFP